MNISTRIIRQALAGVAALVIVGCSTTSGDVAPIEVTVSDYADFEKVISQSIKEAQAKGQKEIFIHLKEDPDIVQPADLVEADYTVIDPQGRVVYSTRPEMFARMDVRYIDPFGQAGTATGPETVLAGFAGLFPGSGQAVLGMRAGERKTVSIPPEKGFGPRDDGKIESYGRRRILPKTAGIPVSAYLKNVGHAPETGKVIHLSPYFPSRVTGVKDGIVMLENVVTDGDVTKDAFGTATMAVKADRIVITLDPAIGAPFEARDKRGVIAGKDDTHFYVDYNHPLAGKSLVFDVEVLGLKKFSTFEKMEIPWIEDHNTAMDQAEEAGKPLVLMLYADWCPWCEKMFATTFEDPRIKSLSDRFVWLKINSDKERVYKEVFGQEGYPMIVLMDRHGETIEKLGGFQDGSTLILYLEKVLTGKTFANSTAHSAKQSTSGPQHCKSEN